MPLATLSGFSILGETAGEEVTTLPRKSYISISAPAGAVMAQEELNGLGKTEIV